MKEMPKFLLSHFYLSVAGLLRFAGYDVRVYNALSRGRILSVLLAEERILVSEDRKIVVPDTQRYRLSGVGHWNWFSQILADFGVDRCKIGSRCSACNEVLLDTDKKKVVGRIPEGVAERYSEFKACLGCGRVYWQGGQYRQMKEKIESLLSSK